MKKLFSFFSMLVLVVLSVGCSDNETEDSVRRIYPTEEQKPVKVSDVYGRLSYDEKYKKWTISCLEFPLAGGDEVGIELIADNIPNDFMNYNGEVCVKGTVIRLFTEVYSYSGTERRIIFYSLQVDKIEKVMNSRANTSIYTCGTQAIEPPLQFIDSSSRATVNNDYILNIYVHIIRTSSGNGLDKTIVSQRIVNLLNYYFVDTNITFALLGSEYIDSDVYTAYNDNQVKDLFNINLKSNAINIYIISNDDNIIYTNGSAAMYSNKCFLQSNHYDTPTLAHEVGHCLGLYHTHKGTATNDYAEDGIPELVNGSNAHEAGDEVVDTPADPCEWIRSTGVYTGTGTDANGDLYNPDPTNFMSYTFVRTRFSLGQTERMYYYIDNVSTLQQVFHTSPRMIEGYGHFCNSAIYNISYLRYDETVNWTVTKYYPSSTADDQPLSSQTTTYSGSYITLNASNQSAYYVIQATINGTTTLTKTVTSYVPSPYVGTLAWETTDGQFGVTTNMEHGNTLYVSGTKTLSLEYLDQGGNTEANFTCITAANRYLSGSTITLQTSDCTRDLKIRTSNSCGTSGNFFTIPCEVTSYSYNLNLNNSTLSIDVEETAKASLASALSIRESDIKTSGDIQSIKVRNADGQVIFTKNYSVATKGVRINTSSWLPGEYILEITNGDMTQKRKIRVK